MHSPLVPSEPVRICLLYTSESYARLNGKTAANVTIQDGARLTGADVRIDRKAFNGTVSLIAEGTRRAIASEAEVEENKLQSTATTSVGTGVVFDIGDAAAGIAIDIYYDENLSLIHICLGYSSAALDGLKDSTTAEVMGKGTAIRAVGGDINVLAADAVSAVASIRVTIFFFIDILLFYVFIAFRILVLF